MSFFLSAEWVEEVLSNMEPYVSRPTKYMQVTFVCPSCGDERIEDYKRQNADGLRIRQYCPDCARGGLSLTKVIPYTVFYHSHAMKRASFHDDVEGECWQCGYKKGERLSYTLSNGEVIKLCPRDFKHYHKRMFQLRQSGIYTDEEN